ncbi:MAG: iron ABC transporter permease [Gammaproteobacteria bacterium]|uniref:Iron ABC transporter permease n=1 Tax=Candidatus Thiopontia autotrophica TaxID=2841688 RepID=A0A8J6P6I6_9GAMM|nr:iron ABC transporter permease [Candidatus Thiopontia autotrophica]
MPWAAVAWGISLFVILPILAVMGQAFFPEENIWGHLLETTLPRYLQSSLLLMVGVGVPSAILGVATAWLVTRYEFPGRRVFQWALLLPFAFPSYLLAYLYTDLLQYSGPVQGYLRELFEWRYKSDYWFPEIRSMGGAMTMFTLTLYPYVYLLARASFLEQSDRPGNLSRLLGCGPWGSFFRVSLPAARPAIAVGTSLVLMETLNDFGTVDFFAVETMTTGIFDIWLNRNNVGGAAQIATLLMGMVLLLIVIEQMSRRRQRQYQEGDSRKLIERKSLTTGERQLVLLVVTLPVILGFVIPFTVLASYAWDSVDHYWNPQIIEYGLNSLWVATLAALLTVTVGLLVTYAKRQQKRGGVGLAHRLAGVGYAMPGAVLAIGVVIFFGWVDRGINIWFQSWFGYDPGLIFSGTLFSLLFAYVVRFLTVATGGLDASLGKIRPSMDHAARSLGEGPLAMVWRVHIPMIRSGLLTAALIVFVDVMKELPATLLLRPFNFETLATHVYYFASDEMLQESSIAALMIVLVGLGPVILLSRTIASHRE